MCGKIIIWMYDRLWLQDSCLWKAVKCNHSHQFCTSRIGWWWWWWGWVVGGGWLGDGSRDSEIAASCVIYLSKLKRDSSTTNYLHPGDISWNFPWIKTSMVGPIPSALRPIWIMAHGSQGPIRKYIILYLCGRVNIFYVVKFCVFTFFCIWMDIKIMYGLKWGTVYVLTRGFLGVYFPSCAAMSSNWLVYNVMYSR